MSDSYPEQWWEKAGDQWNDWFKSGGGGGGGQEFGGLSEEDKAFKKMLYERFGDLPDEYESYTGDRFADRSPEELALLKQAQEGHPMFDKASKDLGFTQGVYKTGAEYDADQLNLDSAKLMAEGSPYRTHVTEQIMRDMNLASAKAGMGVRGQGLGLGAAFGNRGDIARDESDKGFLGVAGDKLTNLNYRALRDARSEALGLQRGREASAGRFGQTALQNLGIGKDKYASRLGSFKDDRSYRDRDLGVDYKDWLDEKNFPYKKLQYGSSLFGNIPIEEKGMTNYPASGGK